jgi:hypothetical protein
MQTDAEAARANRREVMSIACPVWWHARKGCWAWGAKTDHGCALDPDHEGSHLCPCGARKRVKK